MATIQLKAGMVWKGAYDASVPYDKLDVVRNADKTQIAVCKQGGSGIPLTNSNYWEVSIDASGIIALLEDALAHGEIYTMKIGSVTTGASSSATIVNNHQTHETVLNLVLEKGEKGDKGDKGDRGEKGDTVIIGDEREYTLYNQAGNHTDGAMTQAAVTRKFKALDETYARLDGYYESMGVGMATNLKGQNTVDAEFTYRKSGGNVEVQDGNAMIEAIKGNTIAWNQLINNISGFGTASVTVTKDGELNVSNGTVGNKEEYALVFNAATSIIDGHKYLAKFTVSENGKFGFYVNGISPRYDYNGAAVIWQEKSAGGYHHVIIYNPANTTITNVKWHIDLFDLTLIYGSGNEPTSVSKFEQDYFNWFGKPLTYEPYDAGSLRNTKVSALKSVGFNLCDEEWEIGGINSTTGQNVTDASVLRTKNYTKAFPDTTYYLNTSKYLYVYCYDANKNYLGYAAYSASGSGYLNVTKPNTAYIRIQLNSNYGTTYNNDICINLSDPNRNGEYEPYKESTLPLDVTTLTGKLNGEGSSVVVFPNGMEQGDEITIADGVVKAIRRRKVMDLGTPNWVESTSRFNTTVRIDGILLVNNVICSIYENNLAASTRSKNKTICVANVGYIYIYDTSYNDATAFKAAMQGVKLSYELAEPEVYVLDDFSLPKLYPVANGGTEEQLSNSSNSLPATLSIRYGLNAAAFIQNAPKNYISKESMSNFLGNLGSAMGGTWSMVWNSSTNKYDFSFTQNRSVDVEQPIEDK